jgi:predicted ATPase
MITNITLKNFKLHENTELEMAPITIFIGPNNSGKSSIFHALTLLNQASRYPPNYTGLLQNIQRDSQGENYVYAPYGKMICLDLGNYKDIVRNEKEPLSIHLKGEVKPSKEELEIQTSPPPASRFAAPEQKTTSIIIPSIHVELLLQYQNNAFRYYKGFVKGKSWQIEWEKGITLKETVKPQEIDLSFGKITIMPETNDHYIGARSGGFSNTLNLSGEKLQEIGDFFNSFFSAPKQLIQSTHYIHPLRGFEEWAVPVANPPDELNTILNADRATGLCNKLAHDPDLVEKVSAHLKQLLDIELTHYLVQGGKVAIITKKKKTYLVNEGTGAQQIPFIILPIIMAPKEDTILVSEPESHLHPKAQSELAKLFVKIWKKENKQFLIETHSEHILHAFLYAVAKKELNPEQVRIYYFENENGRARVTNVEVDEHGRTKSGLPGFFNQQLKELSDYLDTLEETEA